MSLFFYYKHILFYGDLYGFLWFNISSFLLNILKQCKTFVTLNLFNKLKNKAHEKP